MQFKTIIFLGGVFVFLCSYSVHALDEERGETPPTISAKITETLSNFQQLEEESGSIASTGYSPSSNTCACFGIFCGGFLLLIAYLTGNLHLRGS